MIPTTSPAPMSKLMSRSAHNVSGRARPRTKVTNHSASVLNWTARSRLATIR